MGIAMFYSKYIFNLLRNCRTVSQSGCPISTREACAWAALHLAQYLLPVLFAILLLVNINNTPSGLQFAFPQG